MNRRERHRLAVTAICVFAVCAMLAILLVRSRDEASEREPDAISQAREVHEQPVLADGSRTVMQREAAVVGASPAASEVAMGRVLVSVRRASDGALIPDVGVILTCGGDVDPHATPRIGRTDAGGLVRFEELPPGRAIVELDRCDEITRGNIIAGDETVIEVLLPPGAVIHGLVVRDGQEPVRGASINFYKGMGELPFVLAESDASGRFVLHDVSGGHLIGASLRGLAPTPLAFVLCAAELEQNVVLRFLEVGATVRGTVYVELGNVVAGARLRLREKSYDPLATVMVEGIGSMRRGRPGLATSQPTGQYEFASVGSGKAILQVRADGYPTKELELDIGKDAIVTCDVSLSRGARLSGSVRRKDGQVVEGAEVRLGRPGDFSEEVRRTDSSGRFSFECIPAGAVKCVAEKHAVGKGIYEVEAIAGGEYYADIVIDEGMVIALLLMDEAEREPLRDVTVIATTAIGGVESAQRVGKSDAQGRIRLVNCANAPYSLRVFRAGSGDSPPIVFPDVEPNRPELLLWVPAPGSGTILLTAVDAAGRPCAGAVVKLSRNVGRGWRHGEQTSIGLTDVDGAWEAADLVGGPYRVAIQAANGASWSSEIRELGDEERWDLGRVELQAGGELNVLLIPDVDCDLGAITGTASGVGRSGDRTMERVGDTLRLRGVPPGKWTILFAGKGIAAERVEVEVVSAQVTQITHKPKMAVASFVEVRDERAGDEHRYMLTIESNDGSELVRSFRSAIEPSGWTETVFLENGTYAVRVERGDGVVLKTEMHVDSDKAGGAKLEF